MWHISWKIDVLSFENCFDFKYTENNVYESTKFYKRHFIPHALSLCTLFLLLVKQRFKNMQFHIYNTCKNIFIFKNISLFIFAVGNRETYIKFQKCNCISFKIDFKEFCERVLLFANKYFLNKLSKSGKFVMW